MPSWSENARWTDEQILNARTIIRVGQEVGASRRDIGIALITAIQESALKNINYGDRDSLGLFQQRPSMGWGSRAQVTDPEYAARTFYLGKPGNPGLFSIKNRDQLSMTEAAQKVQRSAFPDAYARHEAAAFKLMGMSGSAASEVKAPASGGWDGMQAPPPRSTRKYPKPPATPPAPIPLPANSTAPVAPTSTQAQNIAAAQAQPVLSPVVQATDSQAIGAGAVGSPTGAGEVGEPVGVAGTAPIGAGDILEVDDFQPAPELPSLEREDFINSFFPGGQPGPVLDPGGGFAPGQGADIVGLASQFIGTPYKWGGNSFSGVDCSGLIYSVFMSKGIQMPRISADQARAGTQIGLGDLKPGDLVAWDNSSRNNGADHIAIYAGNGEIIEAPRAGINVRRRKLDMDGYDSNAWGVRLAPGGK